MFPKALVSAAVRPMMLALLGRGESYGYEIAETLHRLSGGTFAFGDGTLYPLLHRLESEGLIASQWRPTDEGRRRKYYRITPKGEKALAVEREQWLEVSTLLAHLWGPEPLTTSS